MKKTPNVDLRILDMNYSHKRKKEDGYLEMNGHRIPGNSPVAVVFFRPVKCVKEDRKGGEKKGR